MLIKNSDIVSSIANALQHISYYHSPDFLQAMHKAYKNETSYAAKNAIAQILQNSKLAATEKRPLCQDTGIVVVFAKVGMNVEFEGDISLQDLVNAGTEQAYSNADNPLRASVLSPPYGKRINTGNNAPAVLHTEIVAGNCLEFSIAAKGGGSENKAKFAMLNPADSVVDWVVEQVENLGSGWCPPGIIGLGIGGTPEKAMLMAKESLLSLIDIHDLPNKNDLSFNDKLRLELYEKINKIGVGAQGLGGDVTVLDVKLKTYPTHAASMPVALIPNCAATRHIDIILDGSGVAKLTPPDLADYPEVVTNNKKLIKINVDDFAGMQNLKIGDTVLLSGKILTGRDAAHKRIQEILLNGESLSSYGLDFNGRILYYVGPVNPVRDEVVGPAGPTTSGRMDRYTEMMLGECGLAGMIGKAERNESSIELIKQHKSIYFIAVGGAAVLVSKSIKKSRVVAFADLGMEAVYEFEVKDMPVTVAVDSRGKSIHTEGPKKFVKL